MAIIRLLNLVASDVSWQITALIFGINCVYFHDFKLNANCGFSGMVASCLSYLAC